MKINFLVFVFAIIFFELTAQNETKTLSLEECIDYAIANNLVLKNQQLTQSMLENNYNQSKYDLLPDINASSRYSNSFGQTFSYEHSRFINEQVKAFNIGIMSQIYLFEGFRKMHTINKRLLETKIGQQRFDILRNQLTISVLNAYLAVLYNYEQIEIINDQLSTTEQQITKTEKLIASGTLTRGDLLAFITQKADEESQLTGYRNQLRTSRLELAQLMNHPEGEFDIERPDVEITARDITDTVTVDYIYSNAKSFLPEVKLVISQFEVAKEEQKLAQSGYYPTLILSAGISTPYNSLAPNPHNSNTDYRLIDQLKDRRQAELGITLSIPIFNKFRTRTSLANAKINVLSAGNEIEKTYQDLYKVIQSTYNDVVSSYHNYEARKKTVEASEESFRFVQQRFNAGAMSAVDYNIEKNKLNQSKSRLLQSKYELIVKLKILDFYRQGTIEL